MFGAQMFIANMIGLVMVREFSPIFTAIILAGRAGAAFAAEIGTMEVNEEMDERTAKGGRWRLERGPRRDHEGIPLRPETGSPAAPLDRLDSRPLMVETAEISAREDLLCEEVSLSFPPKSAPAVTCAPTTRWRRRCTRSSQGFGEFLAVQEELLLRVLEIVEAAGTSVGFPSQTVYPSSNGVPDARKNGEPTA